MSLLLKPQPQWFDHTQLDELVAYLERADVDASAVPINDSRDLVLSADWRTSSGLRLTYCAFQQLTTLVAPGLCTLVSDISGIRPRSDSTAACSPVVAANILNQCTRLRFTGDQGLHKHVLRVDTRLKAIDAVVSATYCYLPNIELLHRVLAVFSTYSQDYVFGGAVLYGRWLSFVLRQSRPFAATSEGCKLYSAWHVANSEAGECAIGIAPALLFGANLRDGVCQSKGSKLNHQGRRLASRISTLLGRAASRDDFLDAGAAIKIARERFVCQRDKRGQLDMVTLKRNAKVLFRQRVPVSAARAVVASAVQHATDDGVTVWHLIQDAVRLARGQHPRIRHPLERWAFSTLLGGNDGKEKGGHAITAGRTSAGT